MGLEDPTRPNQLRTTG